MQTMRVWIRTLLLVGLMGLTVSPALLAVVHTVQPGETLGKLALRYLPYTEAYTRDELVDDIRAINGLRDEALRAGQPLSIPVRWDEPLRAKSISRPRDFIATGVYLNKWTAGSGRVLAVADALRRHGANTVVFDVKDVTGSLAYRSAIPGRYCPEALYDVVIGDAPKLVEFLHRRDMHVAARVSVFRDMLMASCMPHWRLAPQWLNPAEPEVQDYILEIVRELVCLGVDEIQLDYFRYPADSRTASGREGCTRPEVIAAFLEEIAQVTSQAGVLLSLDIFGIVIWEKDEDILVVGQDIRKMAPCLDIISPMLYPSHFSKDFAGISNPADEPALFVSRGIGRLKGMVGEKVIIRPWLQAFPYGVSVYDEQYVRIQVETSRAAGGTGWCLWNPTCRYTVALGAVRVKDAQVGDEATALLARITASPEAPAPRPERDRPLPVLPAGISAQSIGALAPLGNAETREPLPER